MKRNFTDSEEEQIAKIYLSGKSARSIMRAYGFRHHISIVDALRRQGIEQRSAPERNRLYKLNPHIFDNLDNEASAYLHGFIYADGHIGRDKTLTINVSDEDKVHMDKIRIAMQTEAPVRIVKNYGYGKANARLSFTDRYMASQLQSKGIVIGRTSPELAFSSIPESMFNHWLRGFFDGDGSARKSKSIIFCGSYEFLSMLRDRITYHCQTNPNLAISEHITKSIHYIGYSGRLVALRVADFMYKDATIWLERKRQVIDNWPLPQIRYRNEKGRFT